jgi:AraC-like DNA-binding protein
MDNKGYTGQLYEAPASLDEIIRHYYYVSTVTNADLSEKKLIPNYELLLVFNFSAPISVSFNNAEVSRTLVSRMAVIGPLRKMMNYRLAGGTDAIAVVFTMNGFFRLFKTPISDLGGNDIFDPEAIETYAGLTGLWQNLKGLVTLEERLTLLNEFLLTTVSNNDQGFEALLKSIPYFDNPTIQPVKAIASESMLTERTVQQRFQKYLGFSPKEMLRYKRFKNLINQLLSQPGEMIDLFELIVIHGYHDQSHLTKDFNHFMGTTPGKFIKDVVGKDFCMSKPGKSY